MTFNKIASDIFLKNRKESQNILEYSLFLPRTDINEDLDKLSSNIYLEKNRTKRTYNFKRLRNFNYKDVENWIDSSFEKTHNQCGILLPQYLDGSTFFFRNPRAVTSELHKLTVLERSNRFWYFILKQNAIMSAYDKLRIYISNCNGIETGAEFIEYQFPYGKDNNKDGELAKYGLYYLITETDSNNNILAPLKDNGSIKKPHAKRDTPKRKNYFRSRNSSVTKNNSKLYDFIFGEWNPKLIHIPFNRSKEDYPLIQLQTLELFQYISGRKDDTKTVNIDTIQGLLSSTISLNKSNYTKYIKEYDNFIDELKLPIFDTQDITTIIPKKLGVNLSNVDKLYCRYQFERLFGLELADCLYNNIKSHPKKEYLAGITEYLSCCFSLPNVFSRNLILQTALDNLLVDHSLTEEEHNAQLAEYYFSFDKIESQLELSQDNEIGDLENPYINEYEFITNLFNSLSSDQFNNNFDEDEDIPVDYTKYDRPNTQEDIYNILDEELSYTDLRSLRPLDKALESYAGRFKYLLNKDLNNKEKDEYKNISNTTRIQMQNRIWEGNYINMINSLTKVIFPIFDDYFFNTLWNSLISTLKYDETLKTNKDIEQKCAVEMFKILSFYLDNPATYDSIFNEKHLFDKTETNTYLCEYDSNDVIKPFSQSNNTDSSNADIDYELYERCIKTISFAKTTYNTPYFLSKEYVAPDEIAKFNILESVKNSMNMNVN